MDVSGQPQCIQQVEQSVGGWVSGVEASVDVVGAELFQTTSSWTPALGHNSSRFIGHLLQLEAIK